LSAAVEIYVSHLGSKTEKEHHRKRLENGKEKADPWENIFHRERKTTYIEDADDDTRLVVTHIYHVL
jgi:hypothetical protein